MRTNIRFWAWAALGLILCACNEGGNNSSGGTVIEISPNPANLIPGEKVQFTAVVRNLSGAIVDNAAVSWQSGDDAIVTIDPATGLATGVQLGVTSIVASTATQSEGATVGVVSPNPGGANFDLSGKALYEDKPFDASGFTGAIEPKPIRNAIVNVIAIDTFFLLAAGSTDENGDFSFTGLDNHQRRGGVYLQILTKTVAGNPTQVEIRNNITDRALFTVISPPRDDGAGGPFTGVETTATASSGVGGAFNLLDIFSQASELVQQSGPCPVPGGQCIPPLLTSYWEPGSSEGSFYDDREGVDAIFILGGGTDGDADEYDDSVIAHEYGHFVLRHFSRDDSPGGEHRINDNAQDIRLSWSEGWGDFFSSAVRQSPLYVDTSSDNQGENSFSFEIEKYTSQNFPDLGSLSVRTIYTTNEIAVAGVLWDIFDPVADLLDLSEQHDQVDLGFTPIWQTNLQIQASGSSAHPATMESFTIRFNIAFPAASGAVKNVLNERKMELFPLFPDDTGGTEAPLIGPPQSDAQHHTLYLNGADPVGDEDLFPFDVTPNKNYTVETFNLTNGADTFLTIKNGAAILFENDNSSKINYGNCGVNASGRSTCPLNDKDTLSSSITFSWTGPATTLHAQVHRAPNAPPSAGKLGAYNIRLK